MKPVIVLVGRPNVGKSTLFNRLTRTRDALVVDLPGVTRDRLYGDGRVGDFEYLVVDTGGLSGEEAVLDHAMESQTIQAIDEADVVLFLVDGREGLNQQDQAIAEELRRRSATVIVVANKTDGISEQASLEFYELGLGEPVSIAAAHNRGVRSLMQRVEAHLGISADSAAQESGRRQRRVAFVGRPNVGKSTLINRLIGEQRVIALDQPGTTRDAIPVPFTRGGKDYVLIDTAGVRKRGKIRDTVEKFSVIKTLQAIDSCNVCVYLLDGASGIGDQDLHLIGHVLDSGRALVIAVNKWDALDGDRRGQIRLDIERRMGFLRYCRIHFISALRGSGVDGLLRSVDRAWQSAFVDLATPRLTEMLGYAVSQHQPPLVNGRRIKLRYAHQGGVNPPVIVIHGNQARKVPMNYRRYLSGFFQQELKLTGTPLRIEFRQGDNPYADRARKPGKRRSG